jgi:hypothetical protein
MPAGAQGPRPAPAPPMAGSGLLLFPDLPVYGAPFRTVGGNALRFLFPPGEALFQTMPRCPARLPGPSPLPRRNADPRPAGGHSPRPAPAPPPAGASRPPGRALACRCAWTCQSTGHRSARSGETRAFLVPAGSGSVPDHAGIPGHSGRGHRPCHSATLIPDQPGAQSPRPAPAPPPAGASRQPGRALACGVPGPAGLRGTVPHGRGNAVRFLFPPGGAVFPTMPGCPVSLAGAIAPATALR